MGLPTQAFTTDGDATVKVHLCQSILSYIFHSKNICLEALNMSTYTADSIALSYDNQKCTVRSNGYLKVKGDAVLKCLIEQAWYRSGADPDVHERVSKEVTSLESLHTIGKDHGLEVCLVTPKGKQVITRPEMVAALKAMIGAVQLDGGWNAAEKVAQHLGLLNHKDLAPMKGEARIARE